MKRKLVKERHPSSERVAGGSGRISRESDGSGQSLSTPSLRTDTINQKDLLFYVVSMAVLISATSNSLDNPFILDDITKVMDAGRQPPYGTGVWFPQLAVQAAFCSPKMQGMNGCTLHQLKDHQMLPQHDCNCILLLSSPALRGSKSYRHSSCPASKRSVRKHTAWWEA